MYFFVSLISFSNHTRQIPYRASFLGRSATASWLPSISETLSSPGGVRRAVDKLKDGTTAGAIVGEFLKAEGESMTLELYWVLSIVWQTVSIALTWRRSLIYLTGEKRGRVRIVKTVAKTLLSVGTTWVRQECVLSPKLFNPYMDWNLGRVMCFPFWILGMKQWFLWNHCRSLNPFLVSCSKPYLKGQFGRNSTVC